MQVVIIIVINCACVTWR